MLAALRKINLRKLTLVVAIPVTAAFWAYGGIFEELVRAPKTFEEAQFSIAEEDALNAQGITREEYRSQEKQQWERGYAACAKGVQPPLPGDTFGGYPLSHGDQIRLKCGYYPALIALPKPSISLYFRASLWLLPSTIAALLLAGAGYALSWFAIFLLPRIAASFTRWITS